MIAINSVMIAFLNRERRRKNWSQEKKKEELDQREEDEMREEQENASCEVLEVEENKKLEDDETA